MSINARDTAIGRAALELSGLRAALKEKDAAIAELVEALTDERDAWDDLKSNSISIDGWLRRFAEQRIAAINKAIAKYDK